MCTKKKVSDLKDKVTSYLESHLKQSVSLIKHKVLHRLEFKLHLHTHMHEAAWRRNDSVTTPL